MTELLEVAPTQFLADLGVIPPTQNKNKEGAVKATLFYKLNKYALPFESNHMSVHIALRC